ncbi:hypothetical protein [Tabrizicola sp.]|uniref:hypothetical protein n=1 Tax=Tabrizicola sp. TaxID=2005166 RepID=UPI003F3958AC
MNLAAVALAAALAAQPAAAEPPRISLVFGADALNAQAEDIRSVRRVDEGATGSALVIRLAGSFDRQMAALTRAHVGETGQLLICGEVVVEPLLNSPIVDAMFVISDTDIARIDRLQALLTGPSCGDAPES